MKHRLLAIARLFAVLSLLLSTSGSTAAGLASGGPNEVHLSLVGHDAMLDPMPIHLVKDINAQTKAGGLEPKTMVELNGMLLFSGDDADHGRELWRSEGTEGDTVLVKDINPGNSDALLRCNSPVACRSMIVVNDTLLFFADDGIHGRELWRSDGTAEGTMLVKDINPGASSSWIWSYAGVLGMAEVNGILFFNATTAGQGSELWRSDGTPSGTTLVKDINPGPSRSLPWFLTDVEGTLFFAADDGTHGHELWTSDGTPSGTLMVKDVWPGIDASFEWNANMDPYEVAALNGTFFFAANDGSHGLELWKSDGTARGTVMVQDIRPGDGWSEPNWLTEWGGRLFFRAEDDTHGQELWASDGTEVGTVLVKDVQPGGEGSAPSGLKIANGTLFFTANGELWRSNGTAEGTRVMGAGQRRLSVPSGLPRADMGGVLYFVGSAYTGFEVWRTDGSADEAVLLKDIQPGSEGSIVPWDHSEMAVAGGRLFFGADDGAHGFELWSSDSTEAGTVRLTDVSNTTHDADIRGTTVLGDMVLFQANDGMHGGELWKSDGTANGTQMVKDINPMGAGLGWLPYPTYVYGWPGALEGMLLFDAEDGVHGHELWSSDGTEAGTVMIKDIWAGGESSHPGGFFRVGDIVLFSANDGVHGWELWKSDGTEQGTDLVKDTVPGPNGGGAAYAVAANGTLFFGMDDGVHGMELWKSDGTEEGTMLVKDVLPGSEPSFFGEYSELAAMDGNVFFVATDGSHGIELWKSDGTEAGTVLVRDIVPGGDVG